MCLIEFYKTTNSFQIFFKLGSKITTCVLFLLIYPMKDFTLTMGSLSIQGMQIYGTSPCASADFEAFKGQLISECLFDILNFPKKQRKFLINSCTGM